MIWSAFVFPSFNFSSKKWTLRFTRRFLPGADTSWDGYGREMSQERLSFQTWHTPVNIRAEIKAEPLPTAVHPRQIWQSVPIVWPRPITDNGSPPKPPSSPQHPPRLNCPCTQSRGPRPGEKPRYAEEGDTTSQVLVPTGRSVTGGSNHLQLRRYRELGGCKAFG